MNLLPKLLGIFALVALASCGALERKFSGQEAKSSDGPQTVDDRVAEGDSEPAWAAEISLKCGWGSITSWKVVEVNCHMVYGSSDQSGIPNLTIKVEALNKSSRVWGGAIEVLNLTKDNTFIYRVPVAEASQKMFRAVLDDGDVVVYREFETSALDGMSGNMELVACARGRNHIKLCFDRIQVEVPIFEDSPPSSKESYCKSEDAPDNALCEFWFDAQMGGTSTQIEKWFMKGDELVGDEGAVDARPFCNAYGIVLQNEITEIEAAPTLFPWIQKDDIPCFVPFAPTAEGRSYENKYVAYDKNHTKDGEPFCYFMLVKTEAIEDVAMTQMYIVKNPKLFPNSSNSEFDLDSYEASAKHLACTTQ